MTFLHSRFRTLTFSTLIGSTALLLPTTASATDGYFLAGVGAKSEGAGGVAIAQPEDALAIAANPASATEVGHRLDVGADIFTSNRSATITGNGAGLSGSYSGNGANPFLLPNFGYVHPLSQQLALGIAVYGNGGMNTVYHANPFAAFGGTGDAGVDLKQIFITPTAAVRIAPGHSVGVSPLIVVQGFRAYGIQPFAGYSQNGAAFTNNGVSWATGTGWRVGYLGHLGGVVSFGAFYESKVRTSHFGKYTGLFADQGKFDVPASWGGGIAVKPVPALTLAVDVKRIQYSGVAAVGDPVDSLFAANVPFGATNGPGFGWRDITAIKTGATWRVSKGWTVRAGYGHSDNPIPASQTLLNILAPGVVTSHYTGGATWTSAHGLELTGFVVVAPKNHVYGNGSIPTGFGGGEANIALGETSAGASVGVKF